MCYPHRKEWRKAHPGKKIDRSKMTPEQREAERVRNRKWVANNLVYRRQIALDWYNRHKYQANRRRRANHRLALAERMAGSS